MTTLTIGIHSATFVWLRLFYLTQDLCPSTRCALFKNSSYHCFRSLGPALPWFVRPFIVALLLTGHHATQQIALIWLATEVFSVLSILWTSSMVVSALERRHFRGHASDVFSIGGPLLEYSVSLWWAHYIFALFCCWTQFLCHRHSMTKDIVTSQS